MEIQARKALTQTGGFDLKLNRELAAVEAEFKAKSLPLDSLRSFLQKMKVPVRHIFPFILSCSG